MQEPFFSLIIWAHDTDVTYFRDCMETLVQQTYQKYEVYVLDEARTDELAEITAEFFPESDRAHYRKLKKKNGGAYAYNIGSHFAEGDYQIFVGQHDRLSTNTLEELAKAIESIPDEQGAVIYTDHDELVGLDRMNPHFKGGFNRELFRRTNYIGEFVCIAASVIKEMGSFLEKASYAYMYEYLMKCDSKGVPFIHVSGLLYHKRMPDRVAYDKESRRQKDRCHVEHLAVSKGYLAKSNIICEYEQGVSDMKWDIAYDGSDYRGHQKDYIFVHDPNVRMFTRRNLAKMYGYLKQPDVAVVGVRFLGNLFTVDNIGYVFDEEGIIYPAFHGQKIYHESYEGLATMPRDVSMVDGGYCMIDAKVYRGLHGFDPSLSGRDAMLDFCLRAREKGYRIVVDPSCIARYKNKLVESSEDSHNALMEKQGETIAKGDPYYNKILPLGMTNFVLPGQEEEI